MCRKVSETEAIKFLHELLQDHPLLLIVEMEHRFEDDIVCYRKYVIQFDYAILGRALAF